MTERTETTTEIEWETALGRAWSDDHPWDLLTNLTEIDHRLGGSPGERRAANVLERAFEEVGVRDVRQREFPIRYWERGETEFGVTVRRDGGEPLERSFEAISLPYSPSATVSGPLVDVGYGTPEEIERAATERASPAEDDGATEGDGEFGNDGVEGRGLEGAIVVASTTTPPGQRFVHRMETFGHAAEAGAAAFVFANHVPGQLPPTGSLKFDAEAEIPGVGVSTETGDWLVEYAAEGASARLRVGAETVDGRSQNVIGHLGPESEETVVVLGHYDGHDVAEAALDNGCGIATVLGAAQILAAVEEELDRQVVIAGVGCEEIGLLGAEALAERLDLETVASVVNVDGAGRFRNLRPYTHASEGLREIVDRVARETGQPVVHEPDPHPFSDHWPFLRAGVPSLQLHSEPAAGSERGRGWGHTHADTRDKVDPRNLREHAMLTASLVVELALETVSRIDARDLRAALKAQSYEPGMRAADIWPADWD